MNDEVKLFTDSMDDMLIEFVRTHPLLYQQKDPQYKDKLLKNKVWDEIAVILRRKVPQCKRRWRTIRDSYRKTKQKLMESNYNPQNSNYGPVRSKYNNQCLNFLDDSFKDRAYHTSKMYLERIAKLNRMHPTLVFDVSSSQESFTPEETPPTPPPPPPPPSPPSQDIKDIKPIAEVIDLDDSDEAAKEPQTSEHYIIPDPIPPRQIETESNPLVHLRQYLEPDVELETPDTTNCIDSPCPIVPPVQQPVQQKRAASQDLEAPKKKRAARSESGPKPKAAAVPEHPMDTFFKTMAMTVKSFPPHIAAETKLEVCRVVTQMELRCLSEPAPCYEGPRIVSAGPAPPEEVITIPS